MLFMAEAKPRLSRKWHFRAVVQKSRKKGFRQKLYLYFQRTINPWLWILAQFNNTQSNIELSNLMVQVSSCAKNWICFIFLLLHKQFNILMCTPPLGPYILYLHSDRKKNFKNSLQLHRHIKLGITLLVMHKL